MKSAFIRVRLRPNQTLAAILALSVLVRVIVALYLGADTSTA